MSVPESVVCQNKSSRLKYTHHHLVAVAIGAFVAIHKSQVKLNTKLWSFLKCVTDDELYLISHTRTFNPRTGKVLHLVVNLEGVQASAFIQSFCHRYGTISAECAYFKDVLGTNHLYQHLEQSALQVAARHTPVDGMYVGGSPQPIQIVGLWLCMLQDVFVERHPFRASMAKRYESSPKPKITPLQAHDIIDL